LETPNHAPTPGNFSLHLVWISASALAQAPAAAPLAGTVTGHVYLADNDKPARFATIYLKTVAPADPGDDFFTVLMDSAIVNMQQKSLNGAQRTSADESDLKSARTASHHFMTAVNDAMLSATVAADGSYTFPGVPPGTYYIHAKAPGYIDPLTSFSADDLATNDPATRKRILAAVNTVTVGGSEQVREDLRLERGAVITGRVLYDDGSPAPGWTLRALTPHAASSAAPTILGIDLSSMEMGPHLEQATTDDTGRFRLAGLPGGDFVLKAQLKSAALDRAPFSPVASSAGSFLSILNGLSGMSGLTLTMYSGSASRLGDAESITLRPGEERAGADIIVPLRATHSVAGFVISRRDGHPINSGSVELLAQDHNGNDDASFKLSATINPDGSFRFDYLPTGSYTLRSLHAADTTTGSTMRLLGSLVAERTTNHAYNRSTTTISLEDGDINNLKLPVDDLTLASAH